MFRTWAAAIASAAVVVTTIASASAAPLTAEQVLEQFNLVVFGNVSSSSEVEGRTLIGGNLNGNSSTYFTRSGQVAPSTYGALTVGGNITGGFKNVNGGGNAYVGGNVANMNMNGGTAFIHGNITGNVNGNKQTGVAVTVPDFEQTLKSFSADLRTLGANSTTSIASNKATFNAAPDGDGTAVFSILNGASFFSSINEITFAVNGADTMIINVGGHNMTIAENFLGGIGNSIATKTIWNFYEATSLTFNAEFFGSVLAPYASISNANALNGSVVAKNFNQNGEVHLRIFTGDVPLISVPEPATALLLLSGVAGLIAVRRRSGA